MKKKFKVILISISVIISFILVFAISIIINGTCFKKYDDSGKDNSKWMGNLKDDTLVCDVVIPGSHDAGCYQMNWLGETQQFTIGQQLKMGVRYFDLRVNKKDDNYVIFHSIINGVDFLPILEELKNFIIENPTEILLLDFQPSHP